MDRICIDCRYVNGRPSGIGEMVAALARHVPQQAPDCQFVLLTSPQAPGPLTTAGNVEHRPVAAAANGPATMWYLPLVAALGDIDLFHATANILPAGLTIPSVTTIHDLMWLDRPEWCSPGWFHSVRKAFFGAGIKRALRKSTALAAISEATAAAIARHSPEAITRTSVTLSGVSSDFAPASRDETVLAACKLDPRRRYVLVVGQYAPYKNHRGAVVAFAKACEAMPDVDLVLVQRQGPAAADLLDLARDLHIADRLRLTGAISRAQLIQLYSSAALLLHPSLCEGFGNPVAEAMACGCPVVTSTISAMPEVAGGAALLADPSDHQAIAGQLTRVLEDAALAQELSRRGIARAQDLRWERFAEANLALYRKALARA